MDQWANGPYKILKEFYGTYTIQGGTLNGRDWYRKGDAVISYVGDAWWISSVENKGKATGWMYTLDDHKCPNQPPANTWLYWASCLHEWLSVGTKMAITI